MGTDYYDKLIAYLKDKGGYLVRQAKVPTKYGSVLLQTDIFLLLIQFTAEALLTGDANKQAWKSTFTTSFIAH